MNPVNKNPYQLPHDATWLITGCSSGIGRDIAQLIASKPSHRLIATARDVSSLSYLPDNNPLIIKLPLDVTSPVSVNAAFTAAAAQLGDTFHLDVVVNNAGYSLAGDTESVTEKQMKSQIDTLFYGTVRVTLRAIEVMRQAKNGHHRGGLIINISSVAGVCAFPGNAFYHAGKFAVEGWTESVAREMHPEWNINFCLIEPGMVKTNFETSSKEHLAPHPAYADADMPTRKLEALVKQGLDAGVGVEPADLVAVVYHIASRNEQVPLWLPLSLTAAALIRGKMETRLQELDAVAELTAIDKTQTQLEI
ncbi:hypothetical protein BJX99DRAFT_270380 [Aspergillus californicus]